MFNTVFQNRSNFNSELDQSGEGLWNLYDKMIVFLSVKVGVWSPCGGTTTGNPLIILKFSYDVSYTYSCMLYLTPK